MSLARRSIESSFYNVASHGLQIVVLFIRSVILARILSPEIFGTYTFIVAIISLPLTLSRFGLGSAYVNHVPETSHAKALGVYLSFISISTLIALVIPGFVIGFFLKEEQQQVLLVLIIARCLVHLSVPAQADATRRVTFRRLAIINFIIAAITTITSILLAWFGFGIWSLLSIDMVTGVILIIGFYGIKPVWKPYFAWSTKIARYYLSFGVRTVQVELLNQLLSRSDDLWAGYFLGNQALGFYSRAYAFANYPRNVLAQPISTVALGTYAQLKNDRGRLSQAFFKINSLIIRAGFLFAGSLVLIAPEFVRLVLGEKWLPMIGAFQLMLIFTLLDPIKLTVGKLFVAIGHPKILIRVQIIQLVTLIIGLFTLGWLYNIEGVAMAATIMTVIGMSMLLWNAYRFVDYSIVKLFRVPIMAFMVGFFITLSLIAGLNDAFIHYLILGFIKLIAFVSIYIIIVFIAEYKQIFELFQFISAKFAMRKVMR